MADRRLMVVRRERARERRRRVAMHKHDVRLFLRQHAIKAVHRLRRDVEERLPFRHEVQVIVRRDVEQPEHLVEHLAMLRRDRHDGRDFVWMLLELQHDGRHLDGLRTRPEDRHDFDFLLFHKDLLFAKDI